MPKVFCSEWDEKNKIAVIARSGFRDEVNPVHERFKFLEIMKKAFLN